MQREPESGSDGAPENHRPKKASERRNVTSNYLLAVVTVLVGFIVTPILTHQLGIQRYGVWALIGSLIPFLELLELGFASVTVTFVGRHLELEEHDKVEATINTSFLILSVLGVVAFLGVAVFTFFLPHIITTIPKSLMGQAQFLLLLMAFDMALSIPMDTFGGALVALQRYDFLNYTLITVLTLQAVAWVIVLALHGGLVALGIVTVAISLAGQVSRLLIVHRLLPWFRLSLRRFDRALVRTFTTLSGWYSLDQISYAVIELSDVLIVGAAAGVEAAAVYAVAQRLGPLPTRIVQPRIYTLFTTATELSARDNKSGLRDRTDEVVRFALYLGVPAAIALGFLAGPTVEAWVGPLYREAASVIGLMCVADIVQSWAFTVKISLGGSRRPKLPAILYGLEAALHVSLGIVLASKYGPVGMAWALLIGVVIFEGMLMLPLAYRQLGDSYPRRAIGFARTLSLPTLCTGAVAWVLGRAGGPLFVFTDTHGRFAGLAVVGVAGLALLAVFYAVLLVSMPAAERRPLVARSRVWFDRIRPRDVGETPDRDAEVPTILKKMRFVVDTGRWRTSRSRAASAMAVPAGSIGPAESPNRGEGDMMTEVEPSASVRSVAQWLGSADEPLFAWLDYPEDYYVVGAVVLFPTMGLEAEYSARALRDLAHRLASSRWVVLRMDYPGTGDSFGTWTDPGLVDGWRRSVRVAIEYLQGLGTPRVAVVGLRLGATLAAAELAEASVDDFVMWDPCGTGKAFLREQKALRVFRQNQAIEWGILGEGEDWGSGKESVDDGSLEAPGALFSADTVEALSAVVVSPDARFAARELVLSRQGRKVDRALRERESLGQARFEKIIGQESLLDAQAITPTSTLELVTSWLAEESAPAVRISRLDEATETAQVLGPGLDITERPLSIGPTGLFAIVTEPAQETAASMPTVVFLNAGRLDHQGPAQLWVELSRAWACQGIRCVRVDLSGLGDSPTRPGRTENVEFPADALEDLHEIRQFITTRWGPDIILVGLCSGAYHAIEWALAEPVSALYVVNPALLDYRDENKQPFRRFEPKESSGLSDREAWGATRPWVLRTVSRLGRLKPAVQKIPGAYWVLKRVLVMANPADTFERVSRSGVEVLVVADSNHASSLRKGEQRRWDALLRRDSFHLETISHLEHSLLERSGRERVVELLGAQLRERTTGESSKCLQSD